jgi:hypothetical protein
MVVGKRQFPYIPQQITPPPLSGCPAVNVFVVFNTPGFDSHFGEISQRESVGGAGIEQTVGRPDLPDNPDQIADILRIEIPVVRVLIREAS